MNANHASDCRQVAKECGEELDLLRQNRLLNESQFITFVRDRGVPIWGTFEGDPGDFHRRGWLTSDGVTNEGHPLFHPFRIYPLQQTLESCRLRMAASQPLHHEATLETVKRLVAHLPSDDELGEAAVLSNGIIDLAILLEPIYWPAIIGQLRMSNGLNHGVQSEAYREKVLKYVRTLNRSFWRHQHTLLLTAAGRMDGNRELYILLRLSNWRERERLTGCISGAVWIRQIAEVIRLGFEAVDEERWMEEDQGVGEWPSGARRRTFGAERPLDDVLQAKPYIAYNFGLFTGSAVRWYVEGETEYYAIIEIVPEPAKVGIELVNLHGNIKSGKDNAALKLEEWLKEDKRQRRFSIISIDVDVSENVKVLKRQVELDNIVGMIATHQPDFELANFTVRELAEVAASIGRPLGQKGEEWGRGLARYAIENPARADDGNERPLLQQVRAALHARVSNYDHQKLHYDFDPGTFKQRRLSAGN